MGDLRNSDHLGQDGIETVDDILRIKMLVAERVREDAEHQQGEHDQQRRRVAEQPERTVRVLHVGEPQQVRDHEPAFEGHEVRDNERLHPPVEYEDHDRDDPEDDHGLPGSTRSAILRPAHAHRLGTGKCWFMNEATRPKLPVKITMPVRIRKIPAAISMTPR